jgi:hypothetical protein
MKFEREVPERCEDGPQIVLRSLGQGRYAAEFRVVRLDTTFRHTAAYVGAVAGEALCRRSA